MPPKWRFRIVPQNTTVRSSTVLGVDGVCKVQIGSRVTLFCTKYKVYGKSTIRVYFPIFQNKWMHIVHSYHHRFKFIHLFIRAIPSFVFELVLSVQFGAVEEKKKNNAISSKGSRVNKNSWNEMRYIFFPQILRMRFDSVCFFSLLLLLLSFIRSLFGLWGETECVRVR